MNETDLDDPPLRLYPLSLCPAVFLLTKERKRQASFQVAPNQSPDDAFVSSRSCKENHCHLVTGLGATWLFVS